MKYSIRFGSSSIVSLTLKQQKFEVESLLGINIIHVYERKTPCSIFRNLRTIKLQFLLHIWIYLTNFWLSEKNLQLELLGKKYFDLIEELSPEIMSSSFLKSTFEVTQTTESCNGRMN